MRRACTAFGRWREMRPRRLKRPGMVVGKVMGTRFLVAIALEV